MVKYIDTAVEVAEADLLKKSEMEILSTPLPYQKINPISPEDLKELQSNTIPKKFGKDEDYVEFHVYDGNGEILESIENFTEYKFPPEISDVNSLTNEISVDIVNSLNGLGFTSGKYQTILNIHRKKLYSTFDKLFFIKNISTSRTELRVSTTKVGFESLKSQFYSFLGEIEASPYFKDFILNFGENVLVLGINIALEEINSSEFDLLIKLYNPLPSTIDNKATFRIVESLTNPIVFNIDLGDPEVIDTSIAIRGPNFKIDTRLNNSIPSEFKTYDDILGGSSTSSFQSLTNKLSGSVVPNIQYDNPNTTSGYHFERFTNFSSATERVKNFRYKIKTIDLYNNQINSINTISGPTSESVDVLNNKNSIQQKINKIIGDFDGYESYLYFESGTYAWPKSNSVKPYNLYASTASQALIWVGSEIDTSDYYGGQLYSSSMYDRQNRNNLIYTVPNHIVDNPDNDQYVLFVNMIGQHFDNIWTYIKQITEIRNADNSLSRGISEDLVFTALKSLGVDVFDQFENSDLFDYFLTTARGNQGVGYWTIADDFWVGGVNSNFITASNQPMSKNDITKEVWKRIYHNLPYLLKTKGTERGIKAIMSCYGVPSTILHVKEYGGPVIDQNTYKTFNYDKFSYALRGNTLSSGYFLKPDMWDTSTKTIEFRVKPERLSSYTTQSLWSLISGSSTSLNLKIENYTGTNYVNNDLYGRLILEDSGSNVLGSSNYYPIFDDEFYNISIRDESYGDISGLNKILKISSYKSIDANNYPHTQSLTVNLTGSFGASYLDTWLNLTSTESLGRFENGGYSGSFQEYRSYTELLTDSTLEKHSLSPFMYGGNTVSSSYDGLIARYPLGGDVKNTIGAYASTVISSSNPNFNDNKSATIGLTTTGSWQDFVETHHLISPDTIGNSMTSEKVRIDTGTIDDDILSTYLRAESSTLDRQPLDYNTLGIFFSPQFEMNEDIIYTLGHFRLDDYIGDPRHQTASHYPDLNDLLSVYEKKLERRYNFWDYIKLIQYIDHTLFKIIEQMVPARVNLKTGLLIEPHYLERTKLSRTLPEIDDKLQFYADYKPIDEVGTTGEYLLNELEIDWHKDYFAGSGNMDGNAMPNATSDYYYTVVKPYGGGVLIIETN